MAIGTISSPTTWSNGIVVPPTWLQAVQDNVNGFLAGTDSLKAIVVDGTGGVTSTPVSGAIKFTGTASGTALPTTATTMKTLYGDNIVACWAIFTYSGGGGGTITTSRAFNVSSIVRSGTGTFDITPRTNFSFFTPNVYPVLVSMTPPTSGGVLAAAAYADIAGAIFTIKTYTTAGVVADPGTAVTFSVAVVSG